MKNNHAAQGFSLTAVVKPFSLLLLLVALNGCATSAEMKQAEQRLNGIENLTSQQSKAVQAQNGKLEQQRKDLIDLIKKAEDAGAAARKQLADLQADLEQARLDSAKANGIGEELSQRLERQEKELSSLGKTHQEDVASTRTRLDAVEAKLVQIVSQLSQLSHHDSVAPANPLDQAKADLSRGDAKGAREQLERYLAGKVDPAHRNMAQLLRGDAYLQEGRTEDAVLAWQEIIDAQPKPAELAVALLRQASAFAALKDSESTRYVLKRILEECKETPEVAQADLLLKGLPIKPGAAQK